jgi:acyl-coenzyme A synthetase/AMP-(fatty) acid ligase
MPKYDVGEIITAFNEAASKLNNLRTKYDDLEKENARLRAALRQIGKGDICVALLSHPPICSRAFAARAALGEKE